MAIQWYPGHMHKARKDMAKVLPEIDVIIEVIDARIPWSSENPMLGNLRGDKPSLRVLSKHDLADPLITPLWLDDLRQQQHTDAVAVSTDDAQSYKQILKRLHLLVPAKPAQIRPRVAMVVGIPNVGKSTLINQLAGRVIAKTGNEPAITKRQQVISLGEGWMLRDTPGVLWPKVENEASGFRLAATGAIRDTAMDSAEVAAHLLDYLIQKYPQELKNRYADELPTRESVDTLEYIGRLRGCLAGGGMIDFDRAARLLLQEFRQGKLGRITLETTAMREHEQHETAINMAAQAERREQRRQQRKKRSASK